ncbi:MAG: hypothetical protein MZV64_18635 [Ignavibacteriales bacterium]|nr:hypothetical protein [Ignavibacteriales bacterium]
MTVRCHRNSQPVDPAGSEACTEAVVNINHRAPLPRNRSAWQAGQTVPWNEAPYPTLVGHCYHRHVHQPADRRLPVLPPYRQ